MARDKSYKAPTYVPPESMPMRMNLPAVVRRHYAVSREKHAKALTAGRPKRTIRESGVRTEPKNKAMERVKAAGRDADAFEAMLTLAADGGLIEREGVQYLIPMTFTDTFIERTQRVEGNQGGLTPVGPPLDSEEEPEEDPEEDETDG